MYWSVYESVEYEKGKVGVEKGNSMIQLYYESPFQLRLIFFQRGASATATSLNTNVALKTFLKNSSYNTLTE